MFTRPSLLVIILLLSMLAPIAQAEDPGMKLPADPAALAHFTQGNRLYRLRKFDDAIIEYQAGAMIEPTSVFDYNLGQCYRQLGKYMEAIWHYERFLKYGQPGTERHALVTGFLSQMRAELERETMRQPPADTSPGPSPSAAWPETAPVSPASSMSSVTNRSEHWYSDRIGWGLAGTGVAVGSIGSVLFLNSSNLWNEANKSPSESRRQELRDMANTRERISIAIGISGAVLVAGGVVRLAIRPSAQAKSIASWQLEALPRGLAVSGWF